MDEKIILSSLAMDLKRAAIGYYRGSDIMAKRFLDEALKRKGEYKSKKIKPYILKILNEIEELDGKPKDDIAERALMYSTLIQNFVLRS